DGDETGVLARTALGGQSRFRFDDLAAIVFRINTNTTEADALVQAAIAERRTGRDLLVTADDQPKSVPGTLISLNADGGTFRFGTRDRRFRREKIHAIVFARPATPPPPPLHRLTLLNGDTIDGELLSGDESLLTFTAYGQTVELPVDEIRAVAVRNPRVTYLADLEPIAIDDEGLVHRGWTYRRNRNVGNRPLRLAGRVYPRGLGVHARSSLTYALDGAFDQFAATIGIDDAVGEGGLVAFVVQVDGQERYRSPTLRGAQAPTAIMLDVKGGQTLTLAVAFAGNADIGDWANWADARLIRPQ
ncbi:MAG: NPCBM/NEW2 domain-containing protein, partial [Planctomycetota bacterium]